MSPIASQPATVFSSSKEEHAHGAPDARSIEKTNVSDEKIDALTWLVEQLSNSLSETRSWQTRLAEVLEQSLTSIGRTLAASEARFEEILDERLCRFVEARDNESEASNETLGALGARLDVDKERNEKALSELRAMLDASERTLASSEARLEETLDNRLSRFEQARDEETVLHDQTLKAFAAKLGTEAERNEAAFSDLRASLEIMERNFAGLESQIADAVKGGISLYDQAKKKEAEALRGTVEDLMKQGSIREAIEMHWNKKKP